ncbi:Protein henna [Araneus ventricosus]|uniref:phenylalanine 4-monooxygenase n=1 Tax=Araneus ventricosus TaxID=182803 RepID=A0A4Y2DPC0_ARAVE|nr:Protein henna [Araneus ventricosus]
MTQQPDDLESEYLPYISGSNAKQKAKANFQVLAKNRRLCSMPSRGWIKQEGRNGEGYSRKESVERNLHTMIILFSLKEEVGALAEALRVFKDNKINLYHIESRSSKRLDDGYEFMVECDTRAGNISQAMDQIREKSIYMTVISTDHKDKAEAVPWFPGKIKDLDKFSNHILTYGSELDADHPVSIGIGISLSTTLHD